MAFYLKNKIINTSGPGRIKYIILFCEPMVKKYSNK